MSKVVALIPDLIFRTRVESTGQSLGIGVASAATPEQFYELIDETTAMVIIDLSIPLEAALSAIQQVQQAKAAPKVVAFASHVDADAIRAAKDAGADPVLPRSAFSNQLPDLLQSALS